MNFHAHSRARTRSKLTNRTHRIHDHSIERANERMARRERKEGRKKGRKDGKTDREKERATEYASEQRNANAVVSRAVCFVVGRHTHTSTARLLHGLCML